MQLLCKYLPEYSKFQFCFLKVSRIFFLMFLIYGLLNPWERKYRDLKGWCISIGKKKNLSKSICISYNTFCLISTFILLNLTDMHLLLCDWSYLYIFGKTSVVQPDLKHWTIYCFHAVLLSIQHSFTRATDLLFCWGFFVVVAVVVVCLFCFVLLYCNSHVL